MTALSRRAWLLGLGALGVAPPAWGTPRRFYIQPLGTALPDVSVALVEQALRAFYGFEVKRLPRVALPPSAYYRPRHRYRAEKLLPFLEEQRPADGYRILGLTGVDISTTKGKYADWGILGLATLDGGACVLSSFRCKRKAKGKAHARIRLAKVAVHEIGHTLGLPHCPTVGCLMEDAQGTVLTTDREYTLCPRCRQRLARAGYALPADPQIPWPKP